MTAILYEKQGWIVVGLFLVESGYGGKQGLDAFFEISPEFSELFLK